MNLTQLITEIIPPDDYKHRNGFSNTNLIDSLTDQQKQEVENILIFMLEKKIDLLIIETLSYMKSKKALPILYKTIDKCSDFICKLITASSIFQINSDVSMVNIGINTFKEIEDIYEKITAFYYLRKFNNDVTNDLIKEYTNHSNYLLSYNAAQALTQSL